MQQDDPEAPELIDAFVDAFYDRVLVDPLLAPLFIEVARIELSEHLPRIKAYWRKMLLGDSDYRRHMMRQHREVNAQRKFSDEHYQRWLYLFEQTLQKHPLGPLSERALGLARRVAGNMRQNLRVFSGNT